MKFIFVSSLARSGSTLLAYFLGSHPQIATVSEMVGIIHSADVNKYRCSCGKRIVECEFWAAVTDRMKARGYPFQLREFNTRILLSEHRLLRMFQVTDMRLPFLNQLRDNVMMEVPPFGKRLQARVEQNVALAEVITEIAQKRVFLDASKAYHRIKYLKRFSDLDLYVIHLIRDPRGVVASWHRSGGDAICKSKPQ
jgi:hypothetical protein